MRSMTRLERELIGQLKTEFAHISGAELIDCLFERGMLCYRQIECQAIYRSYNALRSTGRAKCRAMGDVANHYGCSYEKVRAIIYAQTKNETKENGTKD